MVKKLLKIAQKNKAPLAAGLLDSQMAQTVKDSAQQIWLAGLGAFAKAQGEGNKVFDTLIKEGMSLHRRTQNAAEERIGGVTGRMSAMAGQVGNQANAQWDKLESIFEERTAKAMTKLGVPTARDLAALSARLDALTDTVAALGGTTVAVAKKGRAPARKAVAVSPKAVAKPKAIASPKPRAARKTAAPPAKKPARKSQAR